MKKHLLTLTFGMFSTILAFTACKKDKDAEPDQSKTIVCLPDTIDLIEKGKLIIIYNDQRKVTRVNKFNKEGEDNGYIAYEINSNTLNEVEFDGEGTKVYEATHYLNENGSVNHTYSMSNYGFVLYDSTYYSYNSEGNLVLKVLKSRYIDSTKYEYKEGNLISSQTVKSNDVGRSAVYIYTAFVNTFDLLGDRVYIPGFYGKGSKNLLEKKVETINGDDRGIFTETYQYEVNGDGLVTKRNLLIMFSKEPDEPYHFLNAKIKYNCK
jgi:hypothetical protein